jgi:hypothetical protein
MNGPTITMEKDKALAKLEQYEQALREKPARLRTETDRKIADGYRVLARGGRLVDVNETIKAGGLNLAGIPKLAISRASAESSNWRAETRGEYGSDGKWQSIPTGGGRYRWDGGERRVMDDRVRWELSADSFDTAKIQTGRDFRALVPHIPLPLRPKYKLENYFTLWEANWHTLPRDPYLLRPITGALMEIIAEWDLTDLEIAAVKAGMARGT